LIAIIELVRQIKNRSEEKMNKVNFKKIVFGVSLGTVMVLGSMSSAFAADNNHPTAQTKKVEVQQQKSNLHPSPRPSPSPKHQPWQQVTLLTQDQATDIALTQYQGVVKDIQLTTEYGKDVYVIVIHSNDGVDHTVNVDARTGVIF
jgi:uncharacterized membrane protein YkoI